MVPGYYTVLLCNFLTSLDPRVLARYPTCATDPSAFVAVRAAVTPGMPENSVATLRIAFVMATWLSIALYAVGVEIYLQLTPAEGARLREVSYHKQMEAGMRRPGNAGLTAQRLGDAPRWEPPREKGSVASSGSESGLEMPVEAGTGNKASR